MSLNNAYQVVCSTKEWLFTCLPGQLLHILLVIVCRIMPEMSSEQGLSNQGDDNETSANEEPSFVCMDSIQSENRSVNIPCSISIIRNASIPGLRPTAFIIEVHFESPNNFETRPIQGPSPEVLITASVQRRKHSSSDVHKTHRKCNPVYQFPMHIWSMDGPAELIQKNLTGEETFGLKQLKFKMALDWHSLFFSRSKWW